MSEPSQAALMRAAVRAIEKRRECDRLRDAAYAELVQSYGLSARRVAALVRAQLIKRGWSERELRMSGVSHDTVSRAVQATTQPPS